MRLYIPFSYLLATRITTKHERISWLVIYPAFLMIVVILFNGDFSNFIVSFILTMALYEVGYLDNDFRTVRKEKEPTIRASSIRSWINDHLISLVVCRVIIAILLSYLIYKETDSEQHSILVVLLILLTSGFFLHNSLRSRWNIFTYFVIVLCRYLIPVICAIDNIYYAYLVPFVILAFPVIRTLEHSCKEKYNLPAIKRFIRNPDVFRVKWYAAITFILSLSYSYSENKVIIYLLILSMYFLLYRIATLYFSRTKSVLRNKHQSYNWDDNEK